MSQATIDSRDAAIGDAAASTAMRAAGDRLRAVLGPDKARAFLDGPEVNKLVGALRARCREALPKALEAVKGSSSPGLRGWVEVAFKAEFVTAGIEAVNDILED